ncbi:MAG: DNA translocase FtsK [Nitrospirota bacterium]
MVERIRRVREEISGVLALMGSLYLLMSLFTYSVRDPVLFFRTTAPQEPFRNLGGVAGAYLSGWMIILLGVAAYAVPLFFIAFGIKRLLGKEGHRIYLLGGLLFLVSSASLAALIGNTFPMSFVPYPDGIGGLTGKGIASLACQLLSVPGAYLFILALFLSSLILISPLSLSGIALERKGSAMRKKEREVTSEELLADYEDQEILIREPQPEHKTPVSETQPVSSPEPVTPGLQGGYTLPPLELLGAPDISAIRPSKEDLMNEKTLIEQKLDDFGVEGKILQVNPGPIVTMYEFEPAPGIKINKIVALADDLALALKAQSVRISPIPGRAAIGIEVPNRQRETVALREVISSEIFRKSKSKLVLGLGKDISGIPVVADLSKMPHLLVAGATGSGKSVSINSMVMSILYRATPAEVKMLMVDPKLLELSAYEGIPHLISPVITNPKEASDALKKMVLEMERRYRVLAEKSTRNIESYQVQAAEEERLPYIVIIIDELADLMFTAPNDVEDSITRLAQMGRAAGIHLILATQRPSVDVITGIIKANFPARISFQVSSKVDSRTVLDSQGAEQLLGKGDMLLMLPGTKVVRVHGALITEAEIKAVTEFVKVQGSPDYAIMESIKAPEENGDDEDFAGRDEMYHKAVDFGEATGEISISSIQRRLKIGYNRAARIMELMEEDGLVGPPKAAGKPRDFLRRRR